MATLNVEHQKSSLRERVRDKLLSPASSIRLPRFLTNEPALPARYCGKPISTARRPSEEKEEWYSPPDAPPAPSPEVKKSKKRVTRSRDGASSSGRRQKQHPQSRASQQVTRELLTRGHSSPEYHFPMTPPVNTTDDDSTYQPLVIHDLRQQALRLCEIDREIHSGKLYDLIQTLPAIWLPTPKIKESFIPLLRPDQSTAQQKSPTPSELRIIDGFLGHLPDVHLIPAKRIHRKSVNVPNLDFKRTLNLDADVSSILKSELIVVGGGIRESDSSHACYLFTINYRGIDK